ncbi:alpha/beta fold hydrolase [Kocuria oceani]|uniref:alpha/beta fold hydrolase n=1 Tax=Kocuria oceani TaxID=988827 RepID=UPI0040372EA8
MNEPPPVPVGTRELIDIGGRHLNVWRTGDQGPVVLLVHGIPTNHLLWHDVAAQMGAQAQVVAVDMLGYGWSEAPEDAGVDLASQAGHLLDLLDTLSIDRCLVVGHDLGGGVAQILTTVAPDRVQAVGIIDGVCFDGWPVPAVRAMQLGRPVLGRTPPQLLGAGLQRGLRALFVHQDRADTYTPWFAAPWRAPDGPQRLERHLRSLHPAYTLAVAPFLPRWSIPVEVLWARHDSQMKLAYGQRLAQTIPTALLTVVDDAHHFLPADTPAPVLEMVQHLLTRLNGTHPG